LKAITISAIKQCGRLDLPEILVKPTLSKWEELSHPAYFGDISPEAPTLQKTWQKSDSCYFFIGPESGFSPDEITHLRRLHAHGVTLHHNILRAETASIVALSQCFLL
ncbi:MAG: hypothetical protein K940chlam2_01396, partial [Chlamydiae bacterium]|nr:hypothetical protein [Chlamydiota bacterium]